MKLLAAGFDLAGGTPALQLQLHVHRALDRIRAIRRDLFETQSPIHRHRVLHDRFDGIQAHVFIADGAGFGNHRFCQSSPQALATKLLPEIETLHLTDRAFQFVQCDATGQLSFELSQQQPTIGRSVIAGECGQLLVEPLEAQAEAERLRIFEEKFAGLGDVDG